MRLPIFFEHAELNELRRQMGAHALGDLTLIQSGNRLTMAELETLMTGGIDIQSLDEVTILSDGTLAYKDRRVLLYIRDVSEYGHHHRDADSMPKFHVSNCKKLCDMRAQQRYSRYVVAVRNDGDFQINLIRNGITQSSIKRLRVCQFCLEKLGFEKFSYSFDRARRAEIVGRFTVPLFFERWPRDLISGDGIEDENTAPLNDYPGNFGAYALAAKNFANWICQSCKRDLSSAAMRRFLHAHHINGIKYDNSQSNLVPLCILCHSNQPGHQQMKSLPDLAAFLSMPR